MKLSKDVVVASEAQVVCSWMPADQRPTLWRLSEPDMHWHCGTSRTSRMSSFVHGIVKKVTIQRALVLATAKSQNEYVNFVGRHIFAPSESDVACSVI